MANLREFLEGWKSSYEARASKIQLFMSQGIRWSKHRKRRFARLFYHSRGHFDRFLWLMAVGAPNASSRKVVVDNMLDELGCVREGDLTHEELFFRFATHLDKDIRSEAVHERTYSTFLRTFNQGHESALRVGSWTMKLSLFSAYELLDEVDYKNLEELAVRLGVKNEDREFFQVHRCGGHFTETLILLEPIWSTEPDTVCEAFDFIATHQLKMWRELSKDVESVAGLG